MANKSRLSKQLQKARRQGQSPLEVLQMRAIAKREAEAMRAKAEEQATDKAFLYMLAIPLNVLVNDYWPKTAKERAPKFIEEVIKLYEAVQSGNVKESDLASLLEEMAGVKIDLSTMSITTAEDIENESEQ